MNSRFVRLRNLFFTGLLVLVPMFVTVAITAWLFDLLTGQIPRLLARIDHPVVVALLGNDLSAFAVRIISLVVLILMIVLVGLITRNVLGRRILNAVERMFLGLPMVSTIYSTVQQIGHAILAGGSDGMFRQVVMMEYPLPGVYAVAFVTAPASDECRLRSGQDLISVFVPTTPNPTSGFLLLVPRANLIYLDMTVAQGMRMIISGGAVRPPLHETDAESPDGAPEQETQPATGEPAKKR